MMTRRSVLVPTEHQEQVALFGWAELWSGRYPELREMFAVPNFSGRLGKVPPIAAIRQAQKLNREGRKSGIEDVMLLVPRGRFYGLLIELKRQDASPSDVSADQRAWHEVHRDRGFCVEVCKGAEDAQGVLLWYLGGAK